MGGWFSNIQIRYSGSLDSINAEHIADLFVAEHDLIKTDQENADIEIAVFKQESSQWVTVSSDLMDGDIDALLAYRLYE